MKSWARLISVLLVVALILAACSSGKNSGSGSESSPGGSGTKEPTGGNGGQEQSGGSVIELDYWVPFSGSDGEFMETMVKAFNESQSEIKVNFMNNNWDNYYPKLRTALTSNAAPDVAVAHVSELPSLVPTGKLEALDELAAEAGLDWSSFGQNQEQAVIVDGKHYAVPLDTHAVVMFYNNQYLSEAGLLNEDGSIKMEPGAEGFTNMLRTLKSTLPSDVTPMIIGSNNVFTYWIWYALVHQQGGTIMADGKPTIDTPESRKAMELIRTWLDEGLILPDIGDQSYDIFKTGKAAVTFTGVWATGNFETEPTLDFTAAPFPQLFDQPAAWGDSHTIVVPVQSDKNKQLAAVKFADWLASNGHLWAKAGHVPVKPTVLESEEFKALPYRADYADVMDVVKYAPYSDKIGALRDTVLESLVEINYGIVSIEEGLAKAQKNADSILSK